METEVLTTATTTTAATNPTPVADDLSMLEKTDEALKRPVWHFVTIGCIASFVVGFFIGRLSKSGK